MTDKMITDAAVEIKNEEMSEKEKKYHEIQEKRAQRKKLTFEERIFLKEMELSDLKIARLEQLRKDKAAWITSIGKIIKPELEKVYDKDIEDLDLKIAAVLLYSIENYKKILEDIDFTKYTARNSRGKIMKVWERMLNFYDRTY